MKITKISLVLSLVLLISYSNIVAGNSPGKISTAVIPVKAQVFTTAKDTSLRLAQTKDALFEDFGQPFETQVCIFVDPSRKFQTMTGIGGALTDA